MDWLQRRLMKKPKHAGEGNIHYTDVIEAYRTAFGMDWFEITWAMFRGVFQLENEWYKPPDSELIQMIIDADLGDREEWILDFYNCGAFTFNLMGVFHQNRETAAMPIFITWVRSGKSGHAIITFMNEIDLVHFIEPQNDFTGLIVPAWGLALLCG